MRRALDTISSRRTEKDHVGSLLRNIGSGDVHGNTQVGFLKGRGVVDTVSSTESGHVNTENIQEVTPEDLHSDDMA